MDAAKAIRFSDVAGVRNGGVIEAPIITEYRLCIIPLIYAAGGRSGASLKKIIEQYYSFNGRILLSEIVQTNIEKNEFACRTPSNWCPSKRCGIFTGWLYLYT
ncbi:MAG: hypothetical protein WBZ36_22260 [Candidatus Nitrosopolaris sp.]